MKTVVRSLTLALIGFAGPLMAQPVFNSCNQVPTPGDVVRGNHVYLDSTGVVPGLGGANLTWDFSNLLGTYKSPFLDTVLDPFDKLVWHLDVVTGDYARWDGRIGRQFEQDWSHVTFVGSIEWDNMDAKWLYNLRMAACPLQFEASYHGISEGWRTGVSIEIVNYRETYDAYGTLHLPTGTYANILRLHRLDTVYTIPKPLYQETYTWFDPLVNRPRLTMYREWTKGTAPWSIWYDDITAMVVGVPNPQTALALTMSPNPMHDRLQFDLPAQWAGAQFELIALNGQVVRSMKLTAGPQSIAVGDLAPGMYFHKVTDARERLLSSGKVVKE